MTAALATTIRTDDDRVASAIGHVVEPDDSIRAAAADRIAALATPPGSIDAVADVAVRLAASGRTLAPVVDPAEVVVFAGDHGVLASGVSGWPSTITAAMVSQFCRGTATVNAFARASGVTVTVVDVGVADAIPPAPGLIDAKVRPGTANLADGPAMSVDEARAALDVGVRIGLERVEAGVRCLLTGDMGIGNTTPAAALVAALTGSPAGNLVGRGTGIDDATLATKTVIVEQAVGRLSEGSPPLQVAAEVGGLEHLAIAGLAIAGAATATPVVADGVIALAGILLADAIAPGVRHHVVAGHRSPEPAATAALEHLGLRPLLELDLRLGEGSGAVLAFPIVRAATALLTEVATVAEVMATIEPTTP